MNEHSFEGELFPWDEHAPDSWVFVALPRAVSDEIDDALTGPPRGFGSVRVRARVGATEWTTSVFPSKPLATYVLPVKKAVRRAEGLDVGDVAAIGLQVLD